MAASSSKSKTSFQPKRASKNSEQFSQFPVPYDSHSYREWPQYQGVLNGFSVVVEDPESVTALYYGGYFGKGNLSRSKPGEPPLHNDVEDSEMSNPKHGENNAGHREALHLTLEEAFFLSYALGCLRVREGTIALTIEESWTRYCSLQEDFIQKYVAYHHFRSNSWTIRSGAKFGADFLLYKKGPDYYHASYSVLVIPVDKEEEEKLSWRDFTGVNRVTESAAKELILCHVYFPKHCDVRTPLCLPEFSMSEVVLKRWVPAQRRNSEELEEVQ